MKAKSTIKSALLTTNHCHRYGAKPEVNKVAGFAVIFGCNRKFMLDY